MRNFRVTEIKFLERCKTNQFLLVKTKFLQDLVLRIFFGWTNFFLVTKNFWFSRPPGGFIRPESIPLLAITDESFYRGKLSWTLRFPVPAPDPSGSARRFSSTVTFQQGPHSAEALEGALRLASPFSYGNEASHVLFNCPFLRLPDLSTLRPGPRIESYETPTPPEAAVVHLVSSPPLLSTAPDPWDLLPLPPIAPAVALTPKGKMQLQVWPILLRAKVPTKVLQVKTPILPVGHPWPPDPPKVLPKILHDPVIKVPPKAQKKASFKEKVSLHLPFLHLPPIFRPLDLPADHKFPQWPHSFLPNFNGQPGHIVRFAF